MTAEIEADLVGVALIEPTVTNVAIDGHQFTDGTLGVIWDAIRDLHQRGIAPDPAGIIEVARPHRVEHSQVVELVGRMGIGGNVQIYADAIHDRWLRDQLDIELVRARNLLLNPDVTADAIVSSLMQAVDHTSEADHLIEQTRTLDDFVRQELPSEEWVVDGLISRGDRVILTGSEGAGKTVMQRQIAVCTAAGIHPFGEQPMSPRRVLVIDAENPLRIMVNSYGRLRGEIHKLGLTTADRLWIHRFPQGLNLDKASDRLKLHGLCRTYRPDLLVIGPAYKLYVGGANAREEDLARLVTSTLDGLREEFGFAVLLEHHSPHASPNVPVRSVRPIGSSLWMRWPEFGIGLRLERSDRPGQRSAEVVHWRGPRDERPWPERVESGPGMPWIEGAPR